MTCLGNLTVLVNLDQILFIPKYRSVILSIKGKKWKIQLTEFDCLFYITRMS